jgi:hypothetical protein
MISLRELLRIHKESLKTVKNRIDSLQANEDLNYSIQNMHARFTDAFGLLDYYDLTATALLEQQQNLLSLVSLSPQNFQSTFLILLKAFNLETIHQGQAVARLNALAFTFLPLSFVAVSLPTPSCNTHSITLGFHHLLPH